MSLSPLLLLMRVIGAASWRAGELASGEIGSVIDSAPHLPLGLDFHL